MRDRLLANIPHELLQNFAIHFSRPREIRKDVKNILYCHDLAEDPENAILKSDGWKQFDHFVFVSRWQRDQYQLMWGLPHSKCTVIHNAIEKEFNPLLEKPSDRINLIYHTTPHRGLELVYPIFDMLCKKHNNLHLDVFSSFEVYGWKQRDAQYQSLFDKLRSHPKITYHGARPNAEVLSALEKAHIFMYPCIWKETSCIAMIEAIRSNVVCVHPDFGALAETANNQTVMVHMTEDLNVLGLQMYYATDLVISKLNTFRVDGTLPVNSIEVFKLRWMKLLETLT